LKAIVAVTDRDWFELLAAVNPPEVNFWQPSASAEFKALAAGQPLLFKLHSPDNYIVGGGYFAHFSKIPVSLAWNAFGVRNGASSYGEMRRRIAKYRRGNGDPKEDYVIGCIILQDPFFLPRDQWIAPPADFSPNIVRFKGYDLRTEVGRDLWDQVQAARLLGAKPIADIAASGPMFSDPVLVRKRLHQGAFRVLITDMYERRCAVTGERTLPVLEAAHIRPVAAEGIHSVDNGLLLRSDVHTLFDRGYVTITPDCKFRVSRRLREDWQNGRVYYELDGREIWVPKRTTDRPAKTALEWHSDTVFLG